MVLVGALAGVAVFAAPGAAGMLFSPRAAEAQAAPACSSASYDRSYAVGR